MAAFLIAYKRTMANEFSSIEDAWADVPGDAGGETYKGIARNRNPKWAGWSIIDKYKGSKDFKKLLEADAALQIFVQKLYLSNYWNPIWGDKINNQTVANDMYDTAVNMGVGTSIKLAERQFHLPETCKMSETLLTKLNSVA